MSTQEDIQYVVDEFNAVAAEQVQRLRVLAGLVQGLPSSHSVFFSDGEILSTNVLHNPPAVEDLLKRLAPHVTKWQ